MRRILCTITAALMLLTTSAALAQTADSEPTTPAGATERSIRFDLPDRVVGEIVRPMGDAVDGFVGFRGVRLIPDRLTMVDKLVSSVHDVR